ncbi:hypothetical protein [Nonomuraea guangzhouensis]|uniref:Uncharacterized protein n=1 Tax=Nonomuraea guangzhouensis TaxID=1291555 RepID=A0ABW4GXC9_9ACTN|nr:hypothetical protein [Nonomuraea guangzhouensis]
MGFRARWTEEQFEEWFHARFDQWIAERFGELLKAELGQRMPEWADRVDSRFQEGFDTQFVARFDSRFKDRIGAWQDGELKKGFDTWVEHWFDHLFTVWANTWADGADFRERFDQRFDLLFKEKFEEKLDEVVQARVANRVHDLIDLRIEQWLTLVRKRLLAPDEITADEPGDETVDHEQPPDVPDGQAAPTATAGQLAEYLAKKPVGVQQIRRLLRGKEIPGQRPATYPLDEAASALLLRKGRHTKGPKRDADTTEKGENSAAP